MKIFAYSDIGKVRQINEDSIFYTCSKIGKLNNLFIIADGMGGHKAGDYASKYSILHIRNYISGSTENDIYNILNNAIIYANKQIYRESSRGADKIIMGTTIVLATIMDGYVYISSIGDSRLYLINNSIRQITRDHTIAEDMVKKGITYRNSFLYNENKHKLIRAVGAEQNVIIDNFEYYLSRDDKVLMCSDGLTNMLSDKDILNNVKDFSGKDINIAKMLVEKANKNGGTDNISVIMISDVCNDGKEVYDA